ncbi:TF211 [Hepatospora eriocheir]|uniref:TF211 n=1 Tax=Hepatospora eriocheir TaxID=1081669 RepID=A0A1X0QHE4_9MICR|nr:TF211 [Hepatospora eriocheir]
MNYTVTEKECLAVFHSLQHFKSIIFNSKIQIHTDHSNLLFLNSSKLQRVQRWRLLIEEFSPEFLFIKGCNNVAADFLSRVYLLIKEEEKNKSLSIIRKFHNQLIHPGSKRLFNTLKNMFPFITRQTVEDFTSKCKICSTNKRDNTRYGLLSGEVIKDKPWNIISLDIIGPLDLLEEKKLYLLHIIDNTTRYSELKQLKNITSNEVCKLFEENWLLKFPKPTKVLTDNGLQFTSKKFNDLLSSYDITHLRTLVYNPRGNSIIERSHSEGLNCLRCSNEPNITKAIAKVNDAHNSLYHTALKCTPMQLAFDKCKFNPDVIEDISLLLNDATNQQITKNENYLSQINKSRKNTSFEGRLVFVKNRDIGKLLPRYLGPFRVIEDCPRYNCVTVNYKGQPIRYSYRDIKPLKKEESIVPKPHVN